MLYVNSRNSVTYRFYISSIMTSKFLGFYSGVGEVSFFLGYGTTSYPWKMETSTHSFITLNTLNIFIPDRLIHLPVRNTSSILCFIQFVPIDGTGQNFLIHQQSSNKIISCLKVKVVRKQWWYSRRTYSHVRVLEIIPQFYMRSVNICFLQSKMYSLFYSTIL